MNRKAEFYYRCGDNKIILGTATYTRCDTNGCQYNYKGTNYDTLYPNGYPCNNHRELKCGF